MRRDPEMMESVSGRILQNAQTREGRKAIFRKGGFTLPEMLVGLSISLLLASCLLSILSVTLNIWDTGIRKTETFSNARFVLERITTEIQGAFLDEQWGEFSENIDLLSSENCRYIPGRSENIFFVAPAPNMGDGDLCVIAYRHDSKNMVLERAFISSREAWAGSPRYFSEGYKEFAWQQIATGILEFEILSFSEDDIIYGQSMPSQVSWNSESNPACIGRLPSRVMVRLKAVDGRTVQELRNLSPTTKQYGNIVAHNSREFFRVMNLASPNL